MPIGMDQSESEEADPTIAVVVTLKSFVLQFMIIGLISSAGISFQRELAKQKIFRLRV